MKGSDVLIVFLGFCGVNSSNHEPYLKIGYDLTWSAFAGRWLGLDAPGAPTGVASRIRGRGLRAAIGAQRRAHRAAHTELYWQGMQRRDALRWPAQTDR